MQTATELNIPIIDVRIGVFTPHPDPLSHLPFKMRGHYNAEVYTLVEKAIGRRLGKDD